MQPLPTLPLLRVVLAVSGFTLSFTQSPVNATEPSLPAAGFIGPTRPPEPAKPAAIPPAIGRKLRALTEVFQELDAAPEASLARHRLCREAMELTRQLLEFNPDAGRIWAIRGKVALLQGDAHAAWEAGRNLMALGLEESKDNLIQEVLFGLERRRWLEQAAPKPLTTLAPGQTWENTLSMRFVPVPNTPVLFSVWLTRVQDYELFIEESGHKVGTNMLTLGEDGWKTRGRSWKNPGFEQSPRHPAVGVSWDDAQTFCQWLTSRERAMKRIDEKAAYRLPTDREWSLAAGLGNEPGAEPVDRDYFAAGASPAYAWGKDWPPAPGSANLAGEEILGAERPDKFGYVLGYSDGFARTSPVGSFPANKLGLFDMGGNVWQWCQDAYAPGGFSKQRIFQPNHGSPGRNDPAVVGSPGAGFILSLHVDPTNHTSDYKSLRGGSWAESAAASQPRSPNSVTTSTMLGSRLAQNRRHRSDEAGFRVVLALPNP